MILSDAIKIKYWLLIVMVVHVYLPRVITSFCFYNLYI